MQGLAEQAVPGVTPQAISKYETGKMMPSAAVLAGLAQALETSLDFLMSGQIQRLHGVEFRKHSATSAKDRATAEVIVIERLEDYLALEDILDVECPVDPLLPRTAAGVADHEAIEQAADALRKRWHLGTGPIPSVTGLLEDTGVKVVEADLPERISGLACRAKRDRRPDVQVVVVSTRTNVERKRFTLAHELAHRIIRPVDGSAIPEETAMNRFAGAFLVHRQHLLREAGQHRSRITYAEIVRLKRLYGVSAAAMLVRLGQVGVLPERAVTQAFRTFARPWRRTEPDPLGKDEGFAAFERPGRLERLVWHAVGEQLVSADQAAKFLRIPIGDIERGTGGPPPERAGPAGHRPPLAARRAPPHRR